MEIYRCGSNTICLQATKAKHLHVLQIHIVMPLAPGTINLLVDKFETFSETCKHRLLGYVTFEGDMSTPSVEVGEALAKRLIQVSKDTIRLIQGIVVQSRRPLNAKDYIALTILYSLYKPSFPVHITHLECEGEVHVQNCIQVEQDRKQKKKVAKQCEPEMRW